MKERDELRSFSAVVSSRFQWRAARRRRGAESAAAVTAALNADPQRFDTRTQYRFPFTGVPAGCNVTPLSPWNQSNESGCAPVAVTCSAGDSDVTAGFAQSGSGDP